MAAKPCGRALLALTSASAKSATPSSQPAAVVSLSLSASVRHRHQRRRRELAGGVGQAGRVEFERPPAHRTDPEEDPGGVGQLQQHAEHELKKKKRECSKSYARR